jgi:hypothetical protein
MQSPHAAIWGEGIARWFAPYAAVTPGEGGSVCRALHALAAACCIQRAKKGNVSD